MDRPGLQPGMSSGGSGDCQRRIEERNTTVVCALHIVPTLRRTLYLDDRMTDGCGSVWASISEMADGVALVFVTSNIIDPTLYS